MSNAPLLVRAGQPSTAEAASDATHPFAFKRIIVDTSGDLPEACLRFNRLPSAPTGAAATWHPDGPGFATISVIDARQHAAVADFRIE